MDSDKTKSIILKGKKVIARKKGILWENAYSPHRGESVEVFFCDTVMIFDNYFRDESA